MIVGQLFHLIRRDERALWHVQVAHLAGDAHVRDHAPPDDGHTPPVTAGRIGHLLNARDVRGESGHDDAPWRPAKDARQGLSQDLLGGRIAGLFRIGAVREQEQHPLATQLGQLGEIGAQAIYRIVVELEVSRVDYQAHWRVNPQPDPIGDAMADVEELDLERPDRQLIPWRDRVQLHPVDLGLAQLHFDQPSGEPRGVDRGLDLGQQVRQSTHMVFVSVGDDNALDALCPLEHIAEIGDHNIYSQHIVRREHQASVNDEDALIVLQDERVPSDLP